MEFHEIANIFPMMTGDDYNALKDDIETNGLIESVVIYEGKILDGRNRYRACKELDFGLTTMGVDTYDGDDPLGYVISKNLHRRHLNETQRGTVAAKIESYEHGGNRQDANLHLGTKRDDAAKMLNVSPRTVASVKQIEREAPDLLPAMESGEMTVNKAIKEIRHRELSEQRQELAETGKQTSLDERWNIYHGDIGTWQTDKRYDFIITDPPYPKEYLELYSILACIAKALLKPEGLLVAMCGQSYLNDIYECFDVHLNYYWTACYLLPGQPTPLRQRQVNCSWKPLLIYSPSGNYNGKIFGDVFKSDANDKDFHKWGQSISGMYSIISQMCLPGQTILDPFCGAGTTGLAALKHGCLFDGVDIDIDNVNISKGRLSEYDE